MQLFSTGELPCEWEDLITAQRNTYVTIHTLQEAKEDQLALGVSKGEDGVYDVVLDVPTLTCDVIKDALRLLSKVTGVNYRYS